METFAEKNLLCHNAVMKMPRKIIWKFYVAIFSTMALANLISLLYPQSDPFVFYHILITWAQFYAIYYYLAILKCGLTLLCLFPLLRFAFDRRPVGLRFWQWILFARLTTEIFGNFYEWTFVKSAYHMTLGYGLSVTGALLLPLLPSYIAHYIYAFKTNRV